MDDPGSVLRRAYDALASDDLDGVLDLIGRQEIDRVVRLRRDMLSRVIESARPQALDHVRELLAAWNLQEVDDLSVLRPREALRRGLEALPPLGRRVSCTVDGWERAGDALAIVHFHVVWSDVRSGQLRNSTAELHLTPDGWRIRPRALNPWLLPGLENILVSEAG
jgi:hypothetical protein